MAVRDGIEWVTGTPEGLMDAVDEATDRMGWRLAADGLERFRHNIEVNTPVETSALRSSYKLTPVHYGPVRTGRVAEMGWTGSVYTEIDYAEFVERGTGLWGPKQAPYPIRPKTPGGVLSWIDIGGKRVFAKEVWHPGSPGAAMFRIGAVMTEHEVDEWSHRALREWERAVGNDVMGRLTAMSRVRWGKGFS